MTITYTEKQILELYIAAELALKVWPNQMRGSTLEAAVNAIKKDTENNIRKGLE